MSDDVLLVQSAVDLFTAAQPGNSGKSQTASVSPVLHRVAYPPGGRYTGGVKLTVEFDRETDGRWIASVPELAGVHVYGESRDQALAKVLSLAYSVLADEVEHGERDASTLLSVTFDTREAA